MIIRSRLKEKGIDAAIILLLFFLMGIYSCSEKSLRLFTFAGNETKFGTRSFRVKTDISHFDEIPVQLEGACVRPDRLEIKTYGPGVENSMALLSKFAH